MTIKKSIIEKIYNNSLIIYTNILNKKLSINDLYTMIKEDTFNLENLNISKKRLTLFKKELTKYDILDQILLYSDNNFTHLKEIRYLVNLDNFIEYTINENLYLEKLKVYYSYKLLDLLIDKYYDHDNAKMISKIKELLINKERIINIKIINSINRYYIDRITK